MRGGGSASCGEVPARDPAPARARSATIGAAPRSGADHEMRSLLESCAALVAALPLIGQTAPAPLTEGITDSSICYDEARDRLVALTYGHEAWEWDGARWGRILPGPGSLLLRAAWFPPLGKIVGIVGFDLVAYDGHGVEVLGPVPWSGTSIPPMMVTVDHGGGRLLVLVTNAGPPTATLYAWDGSTWQTEATLPGHNIMGLAYDEVRGVLVATVLYVGAPMPLSTFEWDGTSWVNRNAQTTIDSWICFDPANGAVIAVRGDEIAVWNGSVWTPTPSPGAPADVISVVPDHRNARVFAKAFGAGRSESIWLWDGSQWTVFDGPHIAVPTPRPTYDAARGRTVLFGTRPYFATPTLAEWDGHRWLRLSPAGGPTATAHHAQAYDAARQQTLVFGSASSDTWLWDGAAWQQVVGPAPSPRQTAAIAYDSARQRVVLVGGLGTMNLQDHWEWDGASWTQVSPTVPMGNWFGVMAHDAARARLVHVNAIGTTAEYDGLAWSVRVTAGPRSNFNGSNLVWDPVSQRVQGDLALPNARMQWDGVSWQTIGPPIGHYVFDSARGEMLAYTAGGLLVDTATPAAVSAAGPGCGSYSLATSLSTFGSPRIGNADLRFDLRAAPVLRPAIVAFGTGVTQLPLGNGCNLALAGSFGSFFLTTDGQGAASLPFPLPNAPVLRGYVFSAQAAVNDPGSAGGFMLTNGLLLTIGD